MTQATYCLTRCLEDVPESDDWLSIAEKDVLAGFRFSKRRNDWRLGRWTAKRAILMIWPGEPPDPASLEIRAAGDGAPEAFLNGVPAGVALSISHSNRRSFCAVGSPELSIGCDLEKVEPHEVQFFQDYFAPEEIALLESRPADRSLVAYLIWCAKESVLKALREGLRLDTRSVVIRPDFGGPGDSWKPWHGRCTEPPRTFSGWWRCRDGFVYAVTEGRVPAPPNELSAD